MFRKYFFSLSFLSGLVFISCFKLYAQEIVSSTNSLSSTEKKTYLTIRLGQGGFRDNRSPIGKLGGGQLTLDFKPGTLPVAISLSSESYTNSASPTHSYEISNLISINMLYVAQLLNIERANYFLGGGVGRLEVPKDKDDPDATVNGNLYNLEAGIHMRPFRKIGFYGLYKYLYAKKEANNVKVIDFSENIVLLGITYTFSL